MLLASRKAAFSNREIYDAGLATRGSGGQIYDRFRARITFPLCDSRGRVLGFGARAMGEARGAKYVNTPENDIFHKGRVLFGSDHARASAARAGRVIAVEGYTDVLALHQAGMRNCVGIMGTALTEDQVGELSRLAQVVLLALDSDSAGHEAMLRAARVAEGRKLELRVVSLPQGKDPADMVGVSYRDPDGGKVFAYHADKASVDARLMRRTRRGWKLEAEVSAAGCCAYEYASRKPVAGVPVVL